MIANTIPLEELFELLQAYGRPSMNQASASASPGYKVAGRWFVEVSVSPIKPSGPLPDWWFRNLYGGDAGEMPKGWSHVGWRLMGNGDTPSEAATACLEKCIALKEWPCGPYADFISVAEAKRREDASR